MKLSTLLAIIFAILFTACSTKEVYEPKQIEADWKNQGDSFVTIQKTAPSIALVEDRKVLVNSKVIDVTIPADNKLISFSDDWIISGKIDGNLTLNSLDGAKTQELELKKTVATASAKDDVLAVLFTDNEMALYSISTKKILLKERGAAPIVVNSKLVKPMFKDDLVLFSTLDGKVVIINAKAKKKLRTIIVSSEEYFNNIIYFNFVNNKILAATGHKILSYAQKEIRVRHDIRSVVDDGKNIYITTKQGEVISLTPDLQQNQKLKFPFAHFVGMITTDKKLYVLEKEGYLIEIDKDLLAYKVYEVDMKDGYIFIDGKTFYINDEYITVE